MNKKIFVISLFLSVALILTSCMVNNKPHTQNTNAPTAAETEAITDTPSDSRFEAHYIDVGQADSSLIICDNETMLIDGSNVADSSLIVAYLKKHNITSVDYMICTHAHEDHVGGLSGALSVVDVKNIFAPKTEANTKAYQNFKRKAEEQTHIQNPVCGDTFSFGSSTVQFLAPISENTDNLNNTSIVMRITYGNTSFLYTGDAEREEEQDILNAGYNIKSDVLKVGHHGSDSSTGYVFLREVMPQYAIISVGKGNTYGHPTEAVLSRLRDANVNLYRTDLQGDIIAVSDGKTVNISTAKNENIQTNETAVEYDEGTYIGNKNSKKFHRPVCHTLPSEKNRVEISSREEAIKKGYSPCGNCNP